MNISVKRFVEDDRGTTSIEYALIAVLISIFIIGAVTGVGDQISTLFNKVDTTYATATSKI
jgi:pilus assembly protein Flp/PilA